MRLGALLQKKFNFPGGVIPVDRKIETTCPTCERFQTLHEARLERDSDESKYYCAECDALIVAVTPLSSQEWASKGLRVENWIIRSETDLNILAYEQKIILDGIPGSLEQASIH
jgi:hypothetical protein